MCSRVRVVSNLMRKHNNKSAIINRNQNNAETEENTMRYLGWGTVIGGSQNASVQSLS